MTSLIEYHLFFAAGHRIHRVIGRVELAVGANAGVFANTNMPTAHANGVVVDEHVLGRDRLFIFISKYQLRFGRPYS
jgi:hypothetical protein